MKRKRNPLLPKATYIGTVSSVEQMIVALTAAAAVKGKRG
jgi:hypothetical protein